MTSLAPILVKVPVNLHARAKKIAKEVHTTITQIIRDGMYERVVQLERMRDEEEARKKREREEKRGKRRSIGESELAPSKLQPLEARPLSLERVDQIATMYESSARDILKVIDNTPERNLRVTEAINKVKKRFPLTHPSDREILQRIEEMIIRIQSEEPRPVTIQTVQQIALAPSTSPPPDPRPSLLHRMLDAVTGTSIDPGKVKTSGDVGEENE